MTMVWYATFETRFGEMMATANEAGLTGLYFVGQKFGAVIREGWIAAPAHACLAGARRQIEEYLEGRRTTFDVPLELSGTPFQRSVWDALRQIPCGATVTYGDLSRRLGSPTSARAVGAAVGRNPVSVIVPCHRVVGSDGGLVGYAGGVDRKRALLDHERAVGQRAPSGTAPGREASRAARA